MFSRIQKICILAFVIAPVLVFGNANGSTIPEAAAAATTETTIPAAVAAASTAESITATTTTTLASSNAPATITNDVDAIQRTTQHGQNDKVKSATATATMSTTATSTKTTTMTMTPPPPPGNNEDATATSYFASKSRATTVVPVVADQENNNGYEAKTQIKNAKEPTNLELRSTAESKTTNEQEIATSAATTATASTTMKNLMVGTGTQLETQTTASREAATVKGDTPTTTVAAAATTLNNDEHVERQLENGLYRIKLAEIVTDEFSGLHVAEKPTQSIEEQNAREQHYQVLETVDDADGPTYNTRRGKLNIVDLYPMKIEDFNPIIRDANAKILRERTIFTRTDDAEHRQNLLPNEVDVVQEQDDEVTTNAKSKSLLSKTVNHAPQRKLMPKRRDSISDFTGKLLAEQDGVITEIEQRFRLNEYTAAAAATTTSTSTTPTRFSPTTQADSASNTDAPIAAATSSTTSSPESINRKHGKLSFSVNHKIPHASGGGAGGGGGSGHDFIDRRVKKSFDFPMHRAAAASDVMAMPHIDFANTKFNTETRHSPAGSTATSSGASLGNGNKSTASMLTDNIAAGAGGVAGTHPEFSTTKFYNSKELYNEMLQHNKQKLKLAAGLETSAATSTTFASGGATRKGLSESQASSRFGKLKTSAPVQRQDFAAADSKDYPTTTAAIKRVTLTATTTTTTTTTTATPSVTITEAKQSSELGTLVTLKPRKYQKELKRAKLLLKAMMLPSSISTGTTATATATTGHWRTASQTAEVAPISTTSTAPAVASAVDNTLNGQATTSSSASKTSSNVFVAGAAGTTSLSAAEVHSADATSASSSERFAAKRTSSSSVVTSTSGSAAPFSTMPAPVSAGTQHHATNPTKSTSKPIARPRILSRLQEKINTLECELQNVPQDSHLWRGNETHELLLPIVSTEHCKVSEKQQQEAAACAPLVTSWEGEAEIQSGDILIVEINDALLHSSDKNNTNSAHNTQVYQVTRSGHEHCDVTEGILLDITPLVVDGRKLVTLYDKDLTEGVNLLIVVSELWGLQCVRLKVTTKTDNCGENADCSGKGVCYSDAAMEEYECQCCSGFAGPHCEEIDACTPSPCTNNGICVDLSQGHEGNAYQCLCPYGYTGKNCQYELDPCNSAECMNGGTCIGTSTHFRCDCTPGYTGPLCQHSLNECESSPCVHGICVDQEDGFRCFCQPGFAGELCNFEYNECESNPCQNGGECIDHIGSYECRCTKGYSGNRCHIKVDFCANKPCPEGHRCIDHGNDFSCECPGGRNGPDCNQMPRTQCNVNPCTHGGTCWSSGDSFYCACRPGYTGTMCEDEFVVETVVSSSEFMVDDTSARNFNDKTFGSSVVLKSPIELHNAYFGAGVLAAAIFIVAIVVTICHCKVNQTYRKFSTRSTTFFPILGFGRRPKAQNKLNKHWLSGKGLNGGGNPMRTSAAGGAATGGGGNTTTSRGGHLPATNGNTSLHSGQLHERPFQRHLAMNLENDMYYTVDFSENSQHSPLIQ